MAASPEASSPVVLVTSRSFSSGDLDLVGELEAAGVRLVRGPADHDLDGLRPHLTTVSAWIAGTGPITAAHLAAAPRLRLIARYGVGVDAVDLAAAARRGVAVTNTPGANSGAVADHAVALMLALLRRVLTGDRRVRAGDWAGYRSRELAELTVGILGVGRIGRAVARRLAGFGCSLVGHDPVAPAEALTAAGVEPVTWADLTRRSDLVTLHAPGTSVVIDAAWLATVRPGVLLVNTARASLVDEAAVADALARRRLGGYATDTLTAEMSAGPPSPLLKPDLTDRTVFTPHWAGHTIGAVDAMGRGVTDAVLALLGGEIPAHRVIAPAEPVHG